MRIAIEGPKLNSRTEKFNCCLDIISIVLGGRTMVLIEEGTTRWGGGGGGGEHSTYGGSPSVPFPPPQSKTIRH